MTKYNNRQLQSQYADEANIKYEEVDCLSNHFALLTITSMCCKLMKQINNPAVIVCLAKHKH